MLLPARERIDFTVGEISVPVYGPSFVGLLRGCLELVLLLAAGFRFLGDRLDSGCLEVVDSSPSASSAIIPRCFSPPWKN